MGNFFAELKRRHVYRVAAGYAVVGWLLLQFVNNVAPVLDLPPWVARAFLLLIVVGFPVTLIFAWVHQLSSADAIAEPAKTAALDWALVAALLVVIGLVSYQQLIPSRLALTQQPGIASTPASSVISIAVLPLANLSGDAAQEFFSDGMTDEITSALAKVRDLRVVGRSGAQRAPSHDARLPVAGRTISGLCCVDRLK